MAKKRPLLETAPLDQKFFPKEIWEDFFAAEKGMFRFMSCLYALMNDLNLSPAAARERKRPRPRQTNGEDFRGLDLDALEEGDKGGDDDGEKIVVRTFDYLNPLRHSLTFLALCRTKRWKRTKRTMMTTKKSSEMMTMCKTISSLERAMIMMTGAMMTAVVSL